MAPKQRPSTDQDKTNMSLTGMLLDVSASMQRDIGNGIDEDGGTWAHSIFKVIDDLIKHDLTLENRMFAIGVGANCATSIFDVIGTLQQIKGMEIPNFRKNEPATINNIDKILDILEKNGARNIRPWIKDVSLIQEIASDYMATLFLMKLQDDSEFLTKFVNEFLPSACREMVSRSTTILGSIGMAAMSASLISNPITALAAAVTVVMVGSNAEDQAVWGISNARPATREDIHEVVEKAKCYFLKEVQTNSIFSVEEASRIIRGHVNEKELSTGRKQELLENVEPFIYGRTPLFESLEEATKLFKRDISKDKLLFVLSDGDPSDGSNEDSGKIKQITSKLTKAGVTIVSCFITKSTDIHPKHLFDKMQSGWETGAKFLFSLSSEVPTQHLPRAILVKRGWTIDVTNNETKLFVQVNHPDNLREACEMAKHVVCSSDALSELLVSVHLDIYINGTTRGIRAKDQGDDLTCYAFASATVLHLAMERIHGRLEGYPSFEALKAEMISEHGKSRADTGEVLEKICPKYRLRCRKVCIKGAKDAIVNKRPVVARFRLTDDEWDVFENFFKPDKNPFGILAQDRLDVRKRPKNPPPPTSGHAVVLTSYNSQCLTFMNSWGEEWGDQGFFRVQNAEVLGNQLEFFDVYWELDDLSEVEKEKYQKYGSKLAKRLIGLLEGLEFAEYTCPECKQTSLVTEFEGTLSKVRCPRCSREFSAYDNAGNILALNVYLTSLSR